jgi:hypothetical protein
LNLPRKFSLFRGHLQREFCPILCSLFFLGCGITCLARIGIENDEALFATVFYKPYGDGGYYYHLGRHDLPLMILSYLGTLKSWVYVAVFHSFGIGLAALRLPALLAGAATIWILYRLLLWISGPRAAVVGCVLLATDAVYLLTTCFDWGPVALQHLLLLGGILSLVGFWRRRREALLALGFFLFGLALWDKALAVWTLSGMGIAALITFPRPAWRVLTIRRLLLAFLALLLGALPLGLYNIHTHGGTFQGNATYDASELPKKVRALADTFRGSGLFGWMVAEDWRTENPHSPHGWIQLGSAALAERTGHPHNSLLLYGFGAALLLLPLARGTELRALLFLLVTMAVAWVQMALTANAGTALHHTILLWPGPAAFMGISLASASRKLGRAGLPLLGAVLAVLACSGMLLINEYHAAMVRNGGAITWTDATSSLAQYLEHTPAKTIYCLDWGFLDTLRLLSDGRLPVRVGVDPIRNAELNAADRTNVGLLLSQPDSVWVAHVRGYEFYSGIGARLTRFAEASGWRREKVALISDSNGRPTYELFRFLPLVP